MTDLPGAEAFAELRRAMVDEQIAARGIHDPAVLRAMREVPRHCFVDEAHYVASHTDRALPIGLGQTISQPYIVALQTELLQPRPHHRVLEIGTGSGYQTAILARLVHAVYGVERIPELARRTREVLAHLGLTNVAIREGDGTLGWKEESPFDGILVAAAAPAVPDTLCAHLSIGGRLVIPTGAPHRQRLQVITRLSEDQFRRDPSVSCAFVPLIGAEGWPDEPEER